ncbi:MAG: RNA-binding protein [bacterium]
MNIFVGNLSYDTTEGTIRGLFEEHGTVDTVNVITDRDTGRPRGFAFVEMPNDEEAKVAIAALNGYEVDARTLNVNEARPREDRRSGGGGGARFGSGRDSRRGNSSGGGGQRRDRW